MSARFAAFITSFVASLIAAGPMFDPLQSAQVAPPSQPGDRLVSTLLQNRYALSVRDGQLSGAGAQVLGSAIAQSRFVLVGEDHGAAQTPEFLAAVCHAGGPE